MIITIDGPTASGKSTIARLLAEQLGYLYINSGLLFRGLGYILMKRTHSLMASDKLRHDDHQARITLFEKVIAKHPELLDISSIEAIILEEAFHYRFVTDKGPEVFIRHEHITPFLKSPDIDQIASIIGTHPAVRQVLLDYQRELADNHDVVADGRDCGTAVFPHANYKFFLTASLAARAERWLNSHHQGAALDHGFALDPKYSHGAQPALLSVEEVKKVIAERDERDSRRSIAPLKPAADAYIIDSSTMTVQEVITEILAIIGNI